MLVVNIYIVYYIGWIAVYLLDIMLSGICNLFLYI